MPKKQKEMQDGKVIQTDLKLYTEAKSPVNSAEAITCPITRQCCFPLCHKMLPFTETSSSSSPTLISNLVRLKTALLSHRVKSGASPRRLHTSLPCQVFSGEKETPSFLDPVSIRRRNAYLNVHCSYFPSELRQKKTLSGLLSKQ